ncbi:hypothetical protein PQX77_008005 [Marasmius sp. AFHP31]|nr:hypothetical protein PQX77_008005 [Marasmius sp. AFHP31]
MATKGGAPQEFLDWVDNEQNIDGFIKRLGEAVHIPSVSSDPNKREDVKAMSKWIFDEFGKVGVDVKQFDLGTEKGTGLEYPKAVLGRLDVDPSKKTVLIYGHFDVQPAVGQWETPDPFTLVVKDDGRMIARGSTDDKGPVMGWLNVLQYFHDKKEKLPVNLRFCFEGMEESGDDGALDRLIEEQAKPGGMFEGVDCVCVSDNYWLNTKTPIITYGLRGIVYFKLKVWGPEKNLHSGIYGRMVNEPMTDIVHLMSRLVNVDATIRVTGIDHSVPRPTTQEEQLYEAIDYTVKDLQDAIGPQGAPVSNDKNTLLMNRMRECSLTIHGIRPTLTDQGLVPGPTIGTIIPASVTGEFSIRIVPPLTPKQVEDFVTAHIAAEWDQLRTGNQYQLEHTSEGDAWLADYKHWNYEAARTATYLVHRQDPNLTREGGSIPVVLTFANSIKVKGKDGQPENANVVLIPMGRGDDGAHSTNEKLDRSNFLNGTKLFANYLYLLGGLPKNDS